MHYLECIALLRYLLQRLCEGQRVQVPVTVVEEVISNLLNVKTLLGEEVSPKVQMLLNDNMVAASQIRDMQGMESLTGSMKDILVDGVNSIKSSIELEAFEYYKTHDFDDTEEVIPIMRSVVTTALAEGVI